MGVGTPWGKPSHRGREWFPWAVDSRGLSPHPELARWLCSLGGCARFCQALCGMCVTAILHTVRWTRRHNKLPRGSKDSQGHLEGELPFVPQLQRLRSEQTAAGADLRLSDSLSHEAMTPVIVSNGAEGPYTSMILKANWGLASVEHSMAAQLQERVKTGSTATLGLHSGSTWLTAATAAFTSK